MTTTQADARMDSLREDNQTFEQDLAQLEQIVRDLEDGQLGLEDALTRYEAGVGLLKRCYTRLQQAEQRILLLTGIDSEGQPVTQPFDHAATAEPAKPDTKRKRKKNDEPEILF
jgi:exodeoxyribonuclease VII small subunit